MALNNLETKNEGEVIAADDPNQYKTALGENFVPRNTSGAPTDLGGTIGTTIYRWLVGYFQKIIIGVIASGLTIEEDSGDIIIKVGDTETCRIDSSGLDRGGVKNQLIVSDFDSGPFTTASTSGVDVSNLDVTIDHTGGLLCVELSDGDHVPGDGGYVEISDATDDFAIGIINFTETLAGGVGVIEHNIGVSGHDTTDDNGCSVRLPASSFRHVYDLPADTYAFKVQARVNNFMTDPTLAVKDCYLRVYQL